jgi:molybdenum cofactor cytidylyltransferase
MKIAGILLAAGRSTRFGADDKLAAQLDGRPLLHHAADTMRAAPLAWRLLVRSEGAAGLDGFETVRVAQGAEMSRSLAAGIDVAHKLGADAALVTLADMPFVTPDHLAALIDACTGRDCLLASSDGDRRSPPALFGAHWFAALKATTADAGARPLLSRAALIAVSSAMLRDIDTENDLHQVKSRLLSSR